VLVFDILQRLSTFGFVFQGYKKLTDFSWNMFDDAIQTLFFLLQRFFIFKFKRLVSPDNSFGSF